MKLRLMAPEEKVASEGGVWTEARCVALANAKKEKEVHGDIGTEHPGRGSSTLLLLFRLTTIYSRMEPNSLRF